MPFPISNYVVLLFIYIQICCFYIKYVFYTSEPHEQTSGSGYRTRYTYNTSTRVHFV